jgi:hypothetical protein
MASVADLAWPASKPGFSCNTAVNFRNASA